MPARASQFDPFRKFKFRVRIDNLVVAGLTKCSALTVTVTSQDFRSGDMDSYKHKLPGQVAFEHVTLEQGMTNDLTFQMWATSMANYLGNLGTDAEKTPDNFRKNIQIEIYNLNNQLVKSYELQQAWVSKYTISDLDANSNDVLIHMLELQNEGIRVLPAP